MKRNIFLIAILIFSINIVFGQDSDLENIESSFDSISNETLDKTRAYEKRDAEKNDSAIEDPKADETNKGESSVETRDEGGKTKTESASATNKTEKTPPPINKTKSPSGLNGVNYAGIALASIGITTFLAGKIPFIVSLAYYKSIMDGAIYNGLPYNTYNNAQTDFLNGFVAGVVLMGTGFLIIAISIPLFVYKGKSWAIETRMSDGVEVSMNLRF
ncbi:MAG TPA: hypothetical protein PLG34_13765 [Spirochaetota bacterium]|jgi:hypothetical protein|nr:MAG: hypothetical protein BWX91_01929 [Spirochaetes bacterium ADurb.Bin133]HNZ27919.1 hypothetical protein [Spirochaetota bacterium]HPY89036.1 hypothetical protein [Spirochaetota bacterium]HQB62097.1 hypothetical protein [Spirochaetota bacterium]